MAKGLTLTVAAALAASGPIAMAQSSAGSFPAGPGVVYPEIELAVKRDTNIDMQPDAARIADTISYVRPAIRFEARGGVQSYDLGYRGEYARYANDSAKGRQYDYDYDDHEVFAGGDWTAGIRHNFKLRALYLDKIDPPGSLQLALTPTPNHYRQPIFSGSYAYGAQDAAGRVELQAGSYTKTYDNNRQDASNQPLTETLDHSRTELAGTLLLRVQPKTYATLTARQYVYDYTENFNARDSRENYLFAGLRWDVSSVTSGRISFGYQTKKFEPTAGGAPAIEYKGGAWEGGLNWRPLFYSTFDLVAQKRTEEATGAGDFVVNRTTQLVWTHVWGSRITTIVTTAYAKDIYSGTNREDTIWLGGARLLYSVQRWLKLGADYAGSMRESNDDNFDYRRNRFMFLANFTI
jgi:hypothetical protein